MGGPGSLRALRVAVLPEVRYAEKSKGYSPIFEIVGLSAWPRIREEGGMRGVPSFFRCPRARLSRTRALHAQKYDLKIRASGVFEKGRELAIVACQGGGHTW